MEALIDYLTENPLYAAGLAVLLLVLIFAMIRRMLVVAVIAAILSTAYIYYLHDTANDTLARAKEKASDIIDDAGDLLKR